MNIVHVHLPEVLLTSNPSFVLQYVITVLLQLNIESSSAHTDNTINNPQHQRNRSALRECVLDVLNATVHFTRLQLVQQMAFVLHLVTVSIHYSISDLCLLSTFLFCILSSAKAEKQLIAVDKF